MGKRCMIHSDGHYSEEWKVFQNLATMVCLPAFKILQMYQCKQYAREKRHGVLGRRLCDEKNKNKKRRMNFEFDPGAFHNPVI